MTNGSIGVCCVSVDCAESVDFSTEAARRHHDITGIMNGMKIPSCWTIPSGSTDSLPANVELCATLPCGAGHRDAVFHLRAEKARILGTGSSFGTVVAELWQARSSWDLIIRQGLRVVRPHVAEAGHSEKTLRIRGGLLWAPISCSFVGGSRSTVQSLLQACHRRLADAVAAARLFHVHVDLGRSRDSWSEEVEALETLMRKANHEQAKGRLQFAHLHDLPAVLDSQRTKPANSILKMVA